MEKNISLEIGLHSFNNSSPTLSGDTSLERKIQLIVPLGVSLPHN